MQKHRYKISFLLTILLYTLLVAGYLFYIGTQNFSVEEKPKEKIIHMSLSEFVPEVIPPVEEPPEAEIEEPVVEEKIEPEPEIPEPEILEPEKKFEEVIPEPVVVQKPIVKPKPIVKKVKKKPLPKKKKLKKRPKKKKHQKRVKTKSQRKVVKSSKANPAKKNQFLAKLRAKINRAKSYPRIAQRRGMKGSVKVRFTILSNGNVGNISVSGPKVFHSSAKSAIRSAFPISTKNAPFSLPTTVNLSLRYQLR